MAAILYLGYHGNGRHFEFFQTPKELPHTTVDIPTKWIIIWLPNHGYQFPTSKSTWKPNIAQIGGFCIWRPFRTLVTMVMAAILNVFNPKSCHILRWIFLQSGAYGSQTMDINSQHQNLLGSQISLKSEDFCILVAILDSKWPP